MIKLKKHNLLIKMLGLKFMINQFFTFPKFFHPDPTVKRQSGFLMPGFGMNSNNYWYIRIYMFLTTM